MRRLTLSPVTWSHPMRSFVFLAAAVALPITSHSQEATCAPPPRPGMTWASWGASEANGRFTRTSGLTATQVPRLTLKWARSLGEVVNARSQPAVVAGTVYVASEAGGLGALDAATGCLRWSARADAPLRSGVVAAVGADGAATTVFVGDLAGSVHAYDAATGVRRWKVRVDPHFAAIITGTPQLADDVLYVPVSSYESALPAQPGYACCTFRGSVVALDVATGAVRWRSWTIADTVRVTGKATGGAVSKGPSGAAVWSTPTIDRVRGVLYVGTGNNYSDPPTTTSDAVLAMELATGRVVWSRQFAQGDAYNLSCDLPGKANCPASDGPDADIGQPPMLVDLGRGQRVLLVGQKSGHVYAIDPDRQGALRWSVKVGDGGKLGGLHWGSATDGRQVYVALGGQGILAVPDSTVKEGIRMEADPAKGGGLFALDVRTGRILWKAPPAPCASRPRCSPAQSAPLSAIPGVVFSGSLDGYLRAWSTTGGKLLWEMDTAKEYQTVDGGRGRGGSIDAAGPVVAGGMVFVMSGYGLYGAMPGNVLLAFSVDGR
ncbi:MAG: PQQ-binding-like beta-propeller repeat protein [Gemmatimonadetes bacterium]|nr:PQQ-binding-like beta-propeller repeat protein [Gemmatimonadota bacterium]